MGAPQSNGSPRRPPAPRATPCAAGGTREPARPSRPALTCSRCSWVPCPRRRGLARGSHSVPAAARSACASPSSLHGPPPPQSPSSSPAERILPPRKAAGGARLRSARRRHGRRRVPDGSLQDGSWAKAPGGARSSRPDSQRGSGPQAGRGEPTPGEGPRRRRGRRGVRDTYEKEEDVGVFFRALL